MTDDALPLLGRTAVVTGASRGIGRAIAIGLAGSGASVVLVARAESALDAVAAEIASVGGRALAMSMDTTVAADVARLASLDDGWAPASILVNAAGTFGPLAPIGEVDSEEWIDTINVNLVSSFLTCHHLVPSMIAQGRGTILNVSSAASLHAPGPLNSAYGTSKVALNQFTRHLAAELEGTGVQANVLHPGDVQTEMFESIRRDVDSHDPTRSTAYGQWITWMEETGGDPIEKVVDLVLRTVTAEDPPDGRFLWIEDPLQPPIESW